METCGSIAASTLADNPGDGMRTLLPSVNRSGGWQLGVYEPDEGFNGPL
jgi:hypothetical protein